MDFTFQHIPMLSIAGMIFSLAISVAVPVALLIFWMKKTKSKVSSFFIGAGVFIVFALILESLFHKLVLGATGDVITGNTILYGLYGGLAAGIFEETGRLVAMKFLMKKTLNKENAIMYGIGHGGCEAIIILGLTEISNLSIALTINSGLMDASFSSVPDTLKAETYSQLSALWLTNPGTFFAGGVERLSAIILHICLSYIVYKSIKDKSVKTFLMAVAAHALVDFATVFASGNGMGVWALELMLLMIVIVIGFFTMGAYNRERASVPEAQAVSNNSTDI